MKSILFPLWLAVLGLGLQACDRPAGHSADATASASATAQKAAAMPDTWLKPEQVDRGSLWGLVCGAGERRFTGPSLG